MASKLVISAIAMASVGNNRGTITGCGKDGRMRHKGWDGKQWLPSQTGWDNLGNGGGSFKWAPATVPIVPATTGETPGKLVMVGIDEGGRLIARNSSGEGVWGDFIDLGGSFGTPATTCSWNTPVSQPAQPAQPAVAVAGVSTDQQLWIREHSSSSGWNNWINLGGTFAFAPAMTAFSSSQRVVGGVGTDSQLWIRTWTSGGFSAWQSLGGTFIGPVSIISRAPGYMNVYGVGQDQQMWTREYSSSSGWSSWQAMAGSFLPSSPAVVAPSQDRIHCFGKGKDGNIHHKRWTRSGGWQTWENLQGSICKSSPAAGSWTSNHVAVGCVANDGSTKMRSDNGTGWSGWENFGGNLTDGSW